MEMSGQLVRPRDLGNQVPSGSGKLAEKEKPGLSRMESLGLPQQQRHPRVSIGFHAEQGRVSGCLLMNERKVKKEGVGRREKLLDVLETQEKTCSTSGEKVRKLYAGAPERVFDMTSETRCHKGKAGDFDGKRAERENVFRARSSRLRRRARTFRAVWRNW